MPERHFPEPWSVEELGTCFVVKDLNGQALAYMYFEKEPRHRHRRSELLTRAEAQRIAAIFAKLPELARAGGMDDFFFQFRASLTAPASGPRVVSSRSKIAEANATPYSNVHLLGVLTLGFPHPSCIIF